MKIENNGFTLIELLVVISIIGMLASIILVSVNDVRVRAQDAHRLADAAAIKKALELYFDQNGTYPNVNGAASSSSDAGTCIGVLNGARWCTLQTALAPYMNLPNRPDPTGAEYRYVSSSGDNFRSYGLGVMLFSPANSYLNEGDGGIYSWIYEGGTRPKYCRDKYGPGLNGNWFYYGQLATVCVGGN